jgi:hypothetical protein
VEIVRCTGFLAQWTLDGGVSWVMFAIPQVLPPDADLRVCRACGRPFVAVQRLLGVAEGRHVLELRCANCGWHAAESHDGATVAALDRAFVDDTDRMERAADRLAMACALERIERFAAALRDGHIVPEDF